MIISGQRFFLLIIGLLFCVLGCSREHVDMSMLDDHSAEMETHEPVDVADAFAQNILPILTARCALSGCHVAEGPHGLDFRTYESFKAGGEHGPAFIPGNAEGSEVVKQIVAGKMPPPPRDPLTAAEIQLFRDWINQQEAQDHVAEHEHDEHGDVEDMDAHDEVEEAEDAHGEEAHEPMDTHDEAEDAEDAHGEEAHEPMDTHDEAEDAEDAHHDEHDDNDNN